jgi:hypothetical protein
MWIDRTWVGYIAMMLQTIIFVSAQLSLPLSLHANEKNLALTNGNEQYITLDLSPHAAAPDFLPRLPQCSGKCKEESIDLYTGLLPTPCKCDDFFLTTRKTVIGGASY